MKRGTQEEFEMQIESEERVFVNSCKLSAEGGFGDWFVSEKEKGLSPGERSVYIFSLNVPESESVGDYLGEFVFECDEGEARQTSIITIYRDNFDLEILDYKRTDSELRVEYRLLENSRLEHNIVLSYELIDFDGVRRKTGSEEIFLASEEETINELVFELPKDSFGEFVLKMSLNDGTTLVESERDVFLPSKGITGLAVSEGNGRTLSLIGIIVVIGVILFFVVRFAIKIHKKVKKVDPRPSKQKSLRKVIKVR